MRRSFSLLCLISLSLIFVSSFAFAETQKFKYVTLDVPAGWTADESNGGTFITLTNNLAQTRCFIIVGPKNGKTLETYANNLCTSLRGYNFKADTDGQYTFWFNYNASEFIASVFDDETRARLVATGWYCLFGVNTSENHAEDAYNIREYMYVTGDGNSNKDDNGDNNGGDNFKYITVDAPNGWTATENTNGDVVTLKGKDLNNNDIEVRIIAAEKGNKTLKELALEHCNANHGTVISDKEGCILFNDNKGSHYLYMDENVSKSTEYTAKIASGWYCYLIYTTIGTDDENTIINSLVVAGGTGGGGNDVDSQLGGSGGTCNISDAVMSVFVLLSLAVLKRK